MQFRDIIGHQNLKEELLQLAQTGHIPHNILLEMEDGMPAVGLALAWAQYLNCERPTAKDSCGNCPHCKMTEQLMHPDLYFIYPVFDGGNMETPSDNYIEAWREMIANEGAYFDHETWLRYLNPGKKQPIIYSAEANALERKFEVKSSEEGYRIVIIYQLDRINEEGANKMLKLMEEPPEKSIIISTSFDSDRILETTLSRMQRFEVTPLSQEEVIRGLQNQFPQASPEALRTAAIRSQGILLRGIQLLKNSTTQHRYAIHLKTLFEAIQMRNVSTLKKMSETLDAEGREGVVALLDYFEECFRMAYTRSITGLLSSFSGEEEQTFFSIVSGCISAQEIKEFYLYTESAIQHIRGNVSIKMVLFDTFLRYTAILTPKLRSKSIAS